MPPLQKCKVNKTNEEKGDWFPSILFLLETFKKKIKVSPASVAQVVGASLVTEKLQVGFPVSIHTLGCSVGPQLGHLQEVTNWCLSPTLMFLSLSKSNEEMFLREDKNELIKN